MLDLICVHKLFWHRCSTNDISYRLRQKKKKKENKQKKKWLRTYFWGSNILSSKMQDVGSGIATGAANACCTPTTGGGTPGTDSPENA